MHTAILKQLDDTVVVEVPADLLTQLHATPGQSITLRAETSGLALAPAYRPRYTLREMLDQCDFSIPPSDEEQEWVHSPAVGRELL